jgi:hypothetical protein
MLADQVAVGDCNCMHAQLVEVVMLARPRPIAFHGRLPSETSLTSHTLREIEVMVTGYHVYKSIWTAAVGEEFKPLAKNRYRDIVSTCSSASDCM